jgi:pimeloyl-ACP methyl ester carboxylesterase
MPGWNKDWRNAAKLAVNLAPAYRQAERRERSGLSNSSTTALDFSDIVKDYPDSKITSDIIPGFPFCRVWSIRHAEKMPDSVNSTLLMPVSGRTAQIMCGAAAAFHAIGDVRLVEILDPGCVPAPERHPRDRIAQDGPHAITLGNIIKASIAVMRREPGSHLVGGSMSGITAAHVAAYLCKKDGPESIGSLTISGSPLNPSGSPLRMLAMQGAPTYIEIQSGPGKGRLIVPGAVMNVLFKYSGGESCGIAAQDLPAELISGRQGILQWFRDACLNRGDLFPIDTQPLKASDILCPLVTVTGRRDAIVRPGETECLHEKARHILSRKIPLDTTHYGLFEREIVAAHAVPAVARIAATLRPSGQKEVMPPQLAA